MNVRFQEPDTSTSTPSKTTTPSGSAKISLSSSLSALHKHFRNNEHFTKLAANILQLFLSLQSKEKSLKKFDDSEFLPTSSRTKIEIKGSFRSIKDPQFDKIKEVAKADLDAFNKTMATHMKNAAIRERDLLRFELMQKTLKVSDLIVRQQLLISKNDCRDHNNSNALTIKTLEEEHTCDYLSLKLSYLCFKSTKQQISQ